MGSHESLDAGGQSQLRKWKYRRSVRVPTYLPKNTRTAAANFFPLGLPYICLGEQTCRVKGSSGVWEGRDRFCRAGGQGRFKGGQGKADSSSLGELGARLQGSSAGWWKLGGRKDHDRRRPNRHSNNRQWWGRTGQAARRST